MATELEKILAFTTLDVMRRKGNADMAELEKRAAAHTPRGFARALSHKRGAPVIIAELKKASPSRGLIRPTFYPAELAKSLSGVGAAALSVLTNEEFFQGSLDYLEQASKAVTIPCLRKDFIIDPFQILEARAYGADAVLLIVAALRDEDLKALREEARKQGLDVLCEVHDAEEIKRAEELGCECIGVNSRDLKTFQVKPETLTELAPLLPADAVKVAESGIRTLEEIRTLQAAGYQAFLIGEALMKQPDPAGALATMLDRPYASVF